MEQIYNIIPRALIEAIGWTLFHSIWQGILIAVIAGLSLLIFTKFSAQSRYIITIASLFLILVFTTITFVKSYQYTSDRERVREKIISNPQIVVDHFKESLQANNLKTLVPVENAKIRIKWVLFKSNLQNQFPIIVSLWMLGLFIFLFRFMGGLLVINRLKHYHTDLVNKKWENLTYKFSAKLNIKKNIKILQSFAIKVPMTLGYIKPVILLPVSIFTGLTPLEIESIIAHELAHIARRDYLFNIIQSFIEILFFYHPAIWWISSVARTERENSCDDIAIDLTGDKVIYAKALANMQERAISEPAYAIAFGNKKNKLFKRVKRLLNKKAMKTNFKEGFIASCLLFTGILIITLFAGASVTKSYNNSISVNKDTVPSKIQTQPDSISNDELESLNNEVKTDKELKKDKKELFEELDNLDISDNLQKELEVALGDVDTEISYEVLKGIKSALNNMDINAIVQDALIGANAALNSMDINAIVQESMKECNKNNNVDTDKISQEALKGANAALAEMDINKIVNEALKGAEVALNDIDLKKIINESLNEELKFGRNNMLKINNHTEHKYYPIISQGSNNWNKWRNENPNKLPDLSNIKLNGINLQQANLTGISLMDASIEGLDLSKANCSGIHAGNIIINGSNLNGSDFGNANLIDGMFSGNLLVDVNFKYANLQNVNFSGNTIKNCDFRKANLRGTRFLGCTLEKCNFNDAVANENTKFPDGFNYIKHGILME